MKIAFISYEYPPDASYGGIATYTEQAARMLATRGHAVEVFTSSTTREGAFEEDGILVHRVREPGHRQFPSAIAPVFAERHRRIGFDVMESPEYGADGAQALRLVPDIPLVVKLHTPSFLLTLATYEGLDMTDPLRWRLWIARVREYASGLAAGQRPIWRYTHKYALDAERLLALAADEIASPSRALAEIVAAAWRVDDSRLAHVPYPYVPSEGLLALQSGGERGTVTFIGRLEIRKGVLDLARAIPMVLQRHPDVIFRLLGPDDDSPRADQGMREYLRAKLTAFGASVRFPEPVPNEALPGVFETTDIVVLPSIWENFANVCLESMAAGRAVIASAAGGMAEMLGPERAGLIVPPRDHAALARAIIGLVESPQARRELGDRARRTLLSQYNTDRICRLQERSYERAIERRRAAGTRAF